MMHTEKHRMDRIGWLRAAVLGANDGIVSTASLIIGVAAASGKPSDILIAGAAGLAAGSMAMAAGEYVSVSSQSDTEGADIAREKMELATIPDLELDELTLIFINRGLEKDLARQVAVQLTEKDALGTHLREELGISEITTARPIQAAMASAASFAVGAGMPLASAMLAPEGMVIPLVAVASLAFLGLLGAVGAKAGGAPEFKAAFRVTFWGALAMAITAGIGAALGRNV